MIVDASLKRGFGHTVAMGNFRSRSEEGERSQKKKASSLRWIQDVARDMYKGV